MLGGVLSVIDFEARAIERRLCPLLGCPLLGLALAFVWAAPIRAAATAESASELIAQRCVVCHSDAAMTAGLSLERLDASDVVADAAAWEKVLRKVRSGEMPPAGMPGLEPEVADEFTTWLRASLDHAAALEPNPGRSVVHRLNRAEYSNAIRDLLALDIEAGEMLPADDTGYGFDNIASLMTLSPLRLERYLSAARRVARLATGNPDVKVFKEIFLRNRETGFLEAGYPRNVRHDLPFGASGGTSLRYYFPVSADYTVTFDLGDGKVFPVRMPIDAGMHTIVVTFLGSEAKQERTTGGRQRRFGRGGNEGPTPPMDVRLDGRRVELIEPEGAGASPELDALTIEGPFEIRGPGDTASRRAIFTCEPSTQQDEGACAREILSRLARRAYRRPVTDEDVSPLMALFELGAQDGFERGVEKALQALLVSPSFLFRVEKDPRDAAPGTAYRLDDLELASRLSFFLWSSIPDDDLLTLAEQGRLSDPETFEAQVRRMLADRRSESLVENFAGQWLYLRNVMGKVQPDEEIFPEFDVELRRAMARETELFFGSVLREDRSVLTLLDADYTFLNETLAEHYGVEGVHGPQFRKVALSDRRRGGLLGQASILTVTSYPNRTSVVQRGKWVLENLFGMPPPPPPPDIPELESEEEDGHKLTLREAMELHRANPTCASCHARMDPVGFALENFDAIGRWREEDGGQPIDASGTFPNGVEFSGPAGLKQTLLTDYREQFVSTVAEKLLTYALGRGVEYYDQPAVRAIVDEASKKDYRLTDLIVAVAKSVPFQMRRTPQS